MVYWGAVLDCGPHVAAVEAIQLRSCDAGFPEVIQHPFLAFILLLDRFDVRTSARVIAEGELHFVNRPDDPLPPRGSWWRK